ncbi:T9SS type A sorting domain-containing protein [Dyadobacter diqingensis]|uniref:T9SS type A sorting domain-containing protein n=1 Tax=Dyadobacter diqingensis TaxID=2938121 RepID=UPI0020C1A707|nr:T9SS type A sorting domain-containing protein [Dyadobacter diqingensis]
MNSDKFTRAILLAVLMMASFRFAMGQCTAPNDPTSAKVNSTNCSTPNGSITFSAPNPATHVFSIDGGATFAAAGVVTFSGLDAGTYPTVAKLVSTGCVSAVVNKTITKPTFAAGSDQNICKNQTINTAATASSGASWTADPGNPAVAIISNASDPTTLIKGFTTTGTYNFHWGNATCSDMLVVTVSNCDSPIGCVNSAFLIQQTTSFSSPIDLLTVDINTGAQSTIHSDITNPNRSINLNAMGYNVTDGELWGSQQHDNFPPNVVGTGTIFRLGADGIPHYFRIPGLYNAGYNSGTIDNNGILYLYDKDGDLFRVDVNPASPTYLTLLSKSNTAAMNISDFAYNPVDGFIYAVSNTSAHQLYKINPATGAVTTIGNVSGGSGFGSGSIGAAYFDAQGNLYVGDNQSGGIYKINTVQNVTGNVTAVLRSQGQPSSGNDGALCHNACVKPDAGPDIPKICMTGSATMAATQVSGIQWLAQAGNPGTATIADPMNAHTTISGFTAPGVYYFIWSNGGSCNDIATVTVVDNCVIDTKVVNLCCPLFPVIICNTVGAAGHDASTTYTVGTLSATDMLQGAISIDANGCAVWSPATKPTAVVHTFIAACNGAVCDTTFITINPPFDPCPMPVTLISFTATKMDNAAVNLDWITSSEVNSREFQVEKSVDAKNWAILQTVPAANESKTNRNYRGLDQTPFSGMNYYRLKMIDLDDSFAYSRIQSIDAGETITTSLFPNPVSGTLNIRASQWDKVQRVDLINLAGVSVYQSGGGSPSVINVKGFPAGLYLVRLTYTDGSLRINKVTITR